MKKTTQISLLILAGLITTSAFAGDISEKDLTPFVLPWNDGAAGPTDLSFLNHVPAGKFGTIHAGQDGHLYAGQERIRFLGVNLCFGGTVPAKEDAEKIASRMARFGINTVRFHHTDTHKYPGGLILHGGKRSGDLDPEALDRLDNFFEALKKHGIYSNINLLIGRAFCAADGLPAEIEKLEWKLRHTVGMYYPAMLDLQKQYARDLLGHRNTYTKQRYADDPAVAFVEINNENGLLQHWLTGSLDNLPKPFADELTKQWNAWLKKTYADTNALRIAWRNRSEPAGEEMLSALDAPKSDKRNKWNLERHGGAVANLLTEKTDGKSAASHITIEKPGKESWHIQFNHSGLHVRENGLYTLVFHAQADRNRQINVELCQAHEPWEDMGFSSKVNLTNQWQEFRFMFAASADDSNARINFSGMGLAAGKVSLSLVSLRPGGSLGLDKSETIEQGTVPIICHNRERSWSAETQNDFIRFLWDAEQHYWQEMRNVVKKEIGFKGIVMGTIVGCSTPNLQAEFDAVDGHSYWKHPHFPNKPWDRVDWTVGNTSMVNETGGTLAGLSMERVEGKPFTVTEYNHAAPNTYSSEAPLLLAAQAALQDWDGIFLFAYNHSGRWNSGYMTGFFDIDQHPTKMVNLAAAAMLFRGNHVAAAKEIVIGDIDARQEPDLLRRRSRAWQLLNLGQLGLNPAISLLHRTAIHVGSSIANPRKPDLRPPTDLSLLTSDTNEITWDRRHAGKGVVTINTPQTKAVIGFADGRSFKLGDVTITPGKTLQDWSTICLCLVEGKSFTTPGRAILVATGYAQNTGMKWKNAEKTSVGGDWGKSPSLVEVIPAKIQLPLEPKQIEVWSLDEHGQRAAKLDAQASDKGSLIELGSQKTLWYELRILTD